MKEITIEMALAQCRHCLLFDCKGNIPKRLGEVVADIDAGIPMEESQCDICELPTDNFFNLVQSLQLGALLGDDMEDA